MASLAERALVSHSKHTSESQAPSPYRCRTDIRASEIFDDAAQAQAEQQISGVPPQHDKLQTHAFLPLQIFTDTVLLPPRSVISSRIGKLIEVDVKAPFSNEDVRKVQQEHQDLLVEWGDETLCFQMPSASATDLASTFDFQIVCYLKRYQRTSHFGIRPSSSLFRAPPPNSHLKICADSTIFELTGYRQKIDAAYAQNRTIPEDVRVHVTMEVQSKSQSEEVIRNACRREADLMNCISVAVLVKTGFIEIYGPTGRQLSCQHNPVYIDIGNHCTVLKGLRLYLDPLRHSEGWPFPVQPNSYNFEEQNSRNSDKLVAAIQAEDFELGKNIINYMDCLKDDDRPLLEAVKKFTQRQVGGALPFIEYLLDNGARPLQDAGCISAMLVAAASADANVISLFKKYEPSLTLKMSVDDLVGAILKKDLEFITLLLKAGCDSNGQDSHGKEPLLVAIDEGCLDVVNTLIQGGCVLTSESLLLAIDRGREDVVNTLIQGRCVLTSESLLRAIDRGREDVVKSLIQAGCDPNCPTIDGRLALVEAIPKV